METWHNQLSADQRFRLLEMEYDLVIRLQDGPNPLLEELLGKLRQEEQEGIHRRGAENAEKSSAVGADPAAGGNDAMGGGQAFRDAVDRAFPGNGKGSYRGKVPPDMMARMEALFADGHGYTARQIHHILELEYDSMPVGVGMVCHLKTKWNKRQKAGT